MQNSRTRSTAGVTGQTQQSKSGGNLDYHMKDYFNCCKRSVTENNHVQLHATLPRRCRLTGSHHTHTGKAHLQCESCRHKANSSTQSPRSAPLGCTEHIWTGSKTPTQNNATVLKHQLLSTARNKCALKAQGHQSLMQNGNEMIGS